MMNSAQECINEASQALTNTRSNFLATHFSMLQFCPSEGAANVLQISKISLDKSIIKHLHIWCKDYIGITNFREVPTKLISSRIIQGEVVLMAEEAKNFQRDHLSITNWKHRQRQQENQDCPEPLNNGYAELMQKQQICCCYRHEESKFLNVRRNNWKSDATKDLFPTSLGLCYFCHWAIQITQHIRHRHFYNISIYKVYSGDQTDTRFVWRQHCLTVNFLNSTIKRMTHLCCILCVTISTISIAAVKCTELHLFLHKLILPSILNVVVDIIFFTG